MNRRRFLSMLGMLPAALALPKVGEQPKKEATRIVVQSPMNDFRSDLQHATYLVKATGGETILPGVSRTPVERAVDAIIRFEQAFKDFAAAEAELGLPPDLPPIWWRDNQGG